MADLRVITPRPRGPNYCEEDHAATIAFLEECVERAKHEKATFACIVMALPEGAVLDGWSEQKMPTRIYHIFAALMDVALKFRERNIEQP